MKKFSFVSLLLIAALFSCEKEEGLPPDNMLVERFEPLAALPGDTIAIIGRGFNANPVENVVQFNSSRMTPVVVSVNEDQTRLFVVVPEDAQIGNVKVASGPYSTLSQLPFLLSPSISSITPSSGLPGDQIAVTGRNFPTNLSQLLLFIGDVPIDSIFGGSSTQVIFPLPTGLPVGNTTIRIGTKLTATDSVLSPPVAFTVLDPDQPVLISIDPVQGTPGTAVTLSGSPFNPDGTTVIFGAYTLGVDELTSITQDEIIFAVPADYPIDGKGQETVQVSVTVETSKGPLTSGQLNFTVIEPAGIEFFYHAVNVPGSSQDADDSLYRASKLPEGVSKTRLARVSRTGGGVGVEVSSDGAFLYYSPSNLIQLDLKNGIQTTVWPLADLEADVTFDESDNSFYGHKRDDRFYKFNVLSGEETVLPGSQVASASATVKEDASHIYYFVNFNGTVRRIPKAGAENTEQTIHTQSLAANQNLTALAVSNSKIYFAVGPLLGYLAAATTGNSAIYVKNKDGSGSAEVLYTLNGKAVTDLELSEDGSVLYWMVSGNTGAIESAPAAAAGAIQVEIPNIKNGRYFDVLER